MANRETVDNGPVYAMAGVVVALVAAMVIVNLYGTEQASNRTSTFIATVVPLVLGYAVVNRKVEQVRQVAGAGTTVIGETHERVMKIESRIDGSIDKRFDDINAKLDRLIEESSHGS